MASGPFKYEIVFVGRSNVGKSTLFSNLFGIKVKKGKKPGTTIKPNFIKYRDLLITDMPGFGYIHGVSREFNEKVKDFIVRYIEDNSGRILTTVHVIDGKSFIEVVERWEKRGEVPVDIDMFSFLKEVSKPILAVNKIDLVKNPDSTLNRIVDKLGMNPPWTQWKEIVFPVSAKNKDFHELKKALKNILIQKNRQDLISVFK
jgi:GTP-binding protein EngB required for normal cell division